MTRSATKRERDFSHFITEERHFQRFAFLVAGALAWSGRQELGKSEGMLFVAEKDGDIPIWMKDMRIPIDIIWLDAKKKVVHVKRDVWPDNEPHEVYHTPVPARYVLELPAGSTREHGIKPGVTARFTTEGKR